MSLLEYITISVISCHLIVYLMFFGTSDSFQSECFVTDVKLFHFLGNMTNCISFDILAY